MSANRLARVITGIIAALLVSVSGHAKSKLVLMMFPDGSAVGAPFPCEVESAQSAGAEGVARSLYCYSDNGGNDACAFILIATPLDLDQYRQHGMKLVESMHDAVAELTGARRHIRMQQSTYPNIGPSLEYEFVSANAEGLEYVAKGTWIVYGEMLLRVQTMCAPIDTKYMLMHRGLFLRGVTTVK